MGISFRVTFRKWIEDVSKEIYSYGRIGKETTTSVRDKS